MTAVNLDDWELLAQLSQMFRTISDLFSDEVDMHRGQAVVLCTVAKLDGMTQSEIAQQLSVQGATITNMLQRMEEAGLVVRRRDPDDNRLVRVYVTETGRAKEQELNEQFQNMQKAIFQNINDSERAELRRLLRQVLENLNMTG
ncbi:MAG: MarR family transcriptional regulator [Anaerolineae bacterium]